MQPEVASDQQKSNTPGIDTPAHHRVKRLKYAAVTSMGSKIATLLIQLLAMPIAARALGPDQFALYAVLAASIGWIGLVNIGLGPVVTVNSAESVANRDTDSERKFFVSAFYPTAILAGLVGVAVILIVLLDLLPIATIFGASYFGQGHTIKYALIILVVFVVLRSVFSIVESVQIGHQELHVINLRGMVGNVLSLGILLAVARFAPSIINLILAVNGPLFVTQAVNVLMFLFRNRYLSLRKRFFDRAIFLSMVSTGLVFSLAGTLGNYLNHQFSIVMVGRTSSPIITATYAAVINLVILALGIVSAFAIPIWPAIADGVTRGELNWVTKVYRSLVGYSMFYALVGAITISLGGQQILYLLYGNKVVQPSLILMILTSVYLFLDIWEYVHYMILIGLNQIRISSLIYLLRTLFFVISASVTIPVWGELGAVLSLCLSVLLFSSWTLPFLTMSTLAKLRAAKLRQSILVDVV